MPYYPTPEKAAKAVHLVELMMKAFEEGGIVELESPQRNPHYFSFKIREMLRSLQEYPYMIPDGAEELITEQRYMIKTKMREGLVEVHPKDDAVFSTRIRKTAPSAESLGGVTGPPLYTRTGQRGHAEETVDAGGRNINQVEDFIWVADRVKDGARRITNIQGPEKANLVVVEEKINALVKAFGVQLEVAEWNPPELIRFEEVEDD